LEYGSMIPSSGLTVLVDPDGASLE
jgi:hypothetical protein